MPAPPRRTRPLPDVIEIYRDTAAGGRAFRWIRRDAYGHITARSTDFGHKVQAWRHLRRTQFDWWRCRIDDRTRTWAEPAGGASLSRPPDPPDRPPARVMPSIREAQRRL